MIGGLLVARRGALASDGEARHRAYGLPMADPTETRVDGSAIRGEEREGGPLTDEIPPASTNWRSDDEPTVPTQRPAPGEVDQR
jgi:hypothetical protein